jgi:CubicO group peptidase (beta-lactamase class C family)
MPRIPVSLLIIALALSFGGHAIGAPASPAATAKPPPAGFVSALPAPADIQRMLDDRVVTYHDSVGLVVGVIDPGGRAVYARGPARIGNDDSVDGDTIFEVGSVTKMLTGLLLADMARRGQLSLDDPAAKYLPAGAMPPAHGARPISLLDLATHTSGLPRMPPNIAVSDFNNPNAAMSVDQFLRSVGQYELTRDAGQAYEYSNAGYDLLGLVEEKVGGTDYETLLKSRILGPLRMEHTRMGDSLADQDRRAALYDSHLHPVPRSPPGLLPGAEGLSSTANDLLNVLAANLGLPSSPLSPAMADMIRTQRPTRYPQLKAAIGWHVATLHGVDIVFENGQTEGSRAFIGFAPKSRVGVVVLSNAANTIDDIGVHILDPESPLRHLHREVAVNPAVFDNYLGLYRVGDTFSLIVSRDENRLFVQGFGQPRAELFSEGDGRFFLRVVDGEVVFRTDSSGRASGLELTQDGKTVTAQLVQ